MSALILWRSFIWRLVKRRKLCVCSKKISQSETSCCRACSEASKWTSALIRCATSRVSKNYLNASTREFQNESRKLLFRAEAAQRLQGRRRVCGGSVAAHSGGVDLVPDPRRVSVGDESVCRRHRSRFPTGANFFVGV